VVSFPSYDGTRLTYRFVGSGPLLVCYPGGPGLSSDYLEDLGGLAATRTLLLLDSRGTGASELPEGPHTMRFDLLTHDVEALRQHLDLDRFDLLGHSAGGMVAQAYAALHPDRLRRLVLVTTRTRNGEAELSDAADVRRSRTSEPWYADAIEADAALAAARGSAKHRLEQRVRPFWYGQWNARTQAHAAASDAQLSPRAMLRFGTLPEPETEVIRRRCRDCTAPVLVVAGGLDGVMGPLCAREVASLFSNSRIVTLPDAGHFPWVDSPAEFREVVESFLAS